MYQTACQRTYFPLLSTLSGFSDAIAVINGSTSYPSIYGIVKFYQTRSGVIVYSEIIGLPEPQKHRVFGFHIHEGTSCSGNMDDPFSDAMAHYNPENEIHPFHAGDLPPLFSNGGFALSLFLTERFFVSEIIGKTVIIHDKPDDFTTQPSGNSGTKIACGIIKSCYG